MTQSRAEARRKRRRAPSDSAGSVWLQRVWSFVSRPVFIGGLLIVAGIVVMLAPTAAIPATMSRGWWIAAYRFANAVQGSVSLILAAAVFAAAMLAEAGIRRQRDQRQLAPLLAIGLMGAGVLVGVLTWFVAQAGVPTSRLSVPPGQTIESFPAIESGRAFKVMLPKRLFIASVDAEQAKATVELREAGEDSGVRNDIFVGDPLEVAGYRFALVGLELDPRVRTAVLGSEDGIDVRASSGAKVRFVPDGPEYVVRAIVLNYLNVMGPAVELEGPDEDRFWVFQRDAQLAKPLSKIRLRRIESAPVPVFTVARARAAGSLAAGALLFIMGLALFLLFGDVGPTSLNELGPQRELE